MSGKKIYINGPKIRPNMYYYTDINAFDKFLMIKQFKLDAIAGKMHPEIAAVVAQLLREVKLLCVGDQYGNKHEVRGVIDAYYAAKEFLENHTDTPMRDFEKQVDQMMKVDEWFVEKLPASRLTTYEARVKKYDFIAYLSAWNFPDMPDGQCPKFAIPLSASGRPGDTVIKNTNTDINIQDGKQIVKPYTREDTPIKFSDDEEAKDDDIEYVGSDPTQFTPSLILPARGGILVEKAFDDRLNKVRKLRTQIAKSIGKVVRKEMINRGESVPETWTWRSCKSEFSVFISRMVQYFVIYRVFNGLPPGAEKFETFYDVRGQILAKKIGALYTNCHGILRKKCIIDSSAARVKALGDLDTIEKECELLFKVNGKKILENKSVLRDINTNKRPLDTNIDDPWKFVGKPRPYKKSRLDKYGASKSTSVGTPVGGGGSTPIIDDGLTSSERTMLAHMSHLITENNNKLLGKINSNKYNNDESIVDSVQDMILNPQRGISHFSDEYKRYHLTKTKTHGFQLVGEEISKTGSVNGRQRIYDNFVNAKPSRRDQVASVQGKLGLFP